MLMYLGALPGGQPPRHVSRVGKFVCVQDVDVGGVIERCNHRFDSGKCPHDHVQRPKAFVRRVADGDIARELAAFASRHR